MDAHRRMHGRELPRVAEVHGGVLAVEQTRLGQQEDARARRAQHRAACVHALQPFDQSRVAAVVRKNAVRDSTGAGGALTLWHDERMASFARIALRLIEDALRWAVLLFRSTKSVEVENLFLRRQLALYIERGVKPQRIDAATRVSLAVLARLFDWRSTLVVVRPATMIRWHRAGWRLFWRLKSRRGRPPIPEELRALIRRMAHENRLWGEERIANELLLKLGIRISPRTVRKYMPKRPAGQPRGDQRWSTFLKNHAAAILACDLFVAVTATFRMLYVLVIIEHGTRRLAHVNVTSHPSTTMDVAAVEGGSRRFRQLHALDP